ncbi:MAG: SDR family oxidoreductase [Pseudomonadota bacterium]
MRLSGKKAIVTGGSMGLGLCIAEAFVTEGASVVICARDLEQLQQAEKKLRSLAGAKEQEVHSIVCDVADKAEVQALFEFATNKLDGLDILVNNAGVYGPLGAAEQVDSTQWWSALQINLLGTFLTCQQAIEIFKQQKSGKIINLSGGGATSPLPHISAYAASKAAVVRLTETLSEELKEFGIDINAIAPGALNTRLMDEVLDAGPEVVGEDFHRSMVKQHASGATPLEKGALLCIYLGSNESDGITGKLISAVWDSWDEFNNHREDVENTDIYTLRRVVPKDRGMKWETL